MTSIFSLFLMPIYEDLSGSVKSYLLPSLLPGILALVTFDTAYLVLCRKRRKDYRLFYKKNQLILYLMFSYLAFVLYLTILSRPPGSRTGVDLMPFATLSFGLPGDIYAAENILLFIPFGILWGFIPFVHNEQRNCLAGGVLISCCIELMQYITKRGFTQTDDIILNVLGCYIGYIIGSCLIKLKDSFFIRSG